MKVEIKASAATAKSISYRTVCVELDLQGHEHGEAALEIAEKLDYEDAKRLIHYMKSEHEEAWNAALGEMEP